MSKLKYVLGFCFNDEMNLVVLMKKTKPSWQAGLLNGVGGKVEEGESSIDAMVREFKEETGVKTSTSDWSHYASFYEDGSDSSWDMEVYRMKSSSAYMATKTCTEEDIVRLYSKALPENICMPNLYWLIPLAMDWREGRSPVKTVVAYDKGSQ